MEANVSRRVAALEAPCRHTSSRPSENTARYAGCTDLLGASVDDWQRTETPPWRSARGRRQPMSRTRTMFGWLWAIPIGSVGAVAVAGGQEVDPQQAPHMQQQNPQQKPEGEQRA